MFKPALLLAAAFTLLYLLLWPVAIEPQAWQAPKAPGFKGAFAVNHDLQNLSLLDIAGELGPEAVAVASDGCVYVATHHGWIVKLDADGSNPQRWVNTQGRPLGLAFSPSGELMVADAFLGLLAINSDKHIQLLSNQAAGKTIVYANDMAVSRDGRVFLVTPLPSFQPKPTAVLTPQAY